MPELPEVHAHAERLDAALAGAALERFEPLTFTALKTLGPEPGDLDGATLDAVAARGKYLLLHSGSLTFAVHLMQGGRLGLDARTARRPRGGVARWTFEGGRSLLLTEAGTERKAGVWVLRGDPHAHEPLAGLGPDAHTLGRDALAERLRLRSGRLHTVLRDQSVVAGLGRRLANEVCHRARLSPFASTGRLRDDELDGLHAALAAVVAEDLAAERARDTMSTAAQRRAAVHGRSGQPCPVCAHEVQAVAYRDYTIHYCPGCQTGGRILADNTTSKFLR